MAGNPKLSDVPGSTPENSLDTQISGEANGVQDVTPFSAEQPSQIAALPEDSPQSAKLSAVVKNGEYI